MDKSLQHILNKANKQKAPSPKESTPKVFTPNEPYDYVVFTKLVFMSGFSRIIFLVILPVTLCAGFFSKNYHYETTIALLSYAGCVLLYTAVNYVRYQYVFKGWKEKLLFPLRGWDELIRSKKMFCDLCWNDIEIHITPEPHSDPLIRELIEASLLLFCKRTIKAFYTRRLGSESKRNRQDWKLTSPLSATGSANPMVMRYMKNLFEKELSVIASKINARFYVTIVNASEEFEIPIEVNRGNN